MSGIQISVRCIVGRWGLPLLGIDLVQCVLAGMVGAMLIILALAGSGC